MTMCPVVSTVYNYVIYGIVCDVSRYIYSCIHFTLHMENNVYSTLANENVEYM